MTKKLFMQCNLYAKNACRSFLCEPNMRVVSGKTRNFVHKRICNSLKKRK